MNDKGQVYSRERGEQVEFSCARCGEWDVYFHADDTPEPKEYFCGDCRIEEAFAAAARRELEENPPKEYVMVPKERWEAIKDGTLKPGDI